jgi:hypothetical protein
MISKASRKLPATISAFVIRFALPRRARAGVAVAPLVPAATVAPPAGADVGAGAAPALPPVPDEPPPHASAVETTIIPRPRR